MAKMTWSDLSTPQRRGIILGGAAEAVVTAAALVDLAKRPADEVRGPKVAWALGCLIQPFGPLAYFAVGRR